VNYFIKESPYRRLIAGVNTLVPLANGTMVPYINFDNAATTPPLISVLQALNNFSPWYSSVNRGAGYKSQISSKLYEDSRNIILNFVQANLDNDIAIYVKNTTEGINKLANRLYDKDKNSIILSTEMEHHSNDLPWRAKYKVDYIMIEKDGRLSLNDLENKLKKYNGLVKLVTVTGASNVTGLLNPIHEIAKIAHKYNSKILVDGAQLVPHAVVNMKPMDSSEHIDFLVFSAHKMYAPFGIGVLIGPKDVFTFGEPDNKGGGTVDLVTRENVIWANPPEKEEAGTQNLMGVIALTSAMKTLKEIGMDNLVAYERNLTNYALSKLKNINEIETYGSIDDSNERVSIISFNIRGMHHSIAAEILAKEAGIGVRTGCFCAHPYIQKLLKLSKEDIEKLSISSDIPRPGMVRISFGLYNGTNEIDYFINTLTAIIKNKDYFIKKYSKKA
jgi:selenocysteine lyase/cysteine desulfurase